MVNDLSISGQFPDVPSFRSAVDRVMAMRKLARQFGRELHCHRNLSHAQVTRDLMMPQVIQRLEQAERGALMQWLTRHGPFWEDGRVHGPDDYLECSHQIVTDTAVGEAAFRCFYGADSRLVSLTPSSWEHTPLSVCWSLPDGDNRDIKVANHITVEDLEVALRSAPGPIESWKQLALMSQARFHNLTFSATAFDPLHGLPLAPGAVQRILERLDVLEQMKCCFDPSGRRTPEGHRLYQAHFTGDKAWFSDSSDVEKNEFRAELTFRYPEIDGESLFCTMHGKVKTPQIRIHFSWPVRADVPLYIAYVGPKITKR
jgi:hypothetical protein